jgi:hypothetical protein
MSEEAGVAKVPVFWLYSGVGTFMPIKQWVFDHLTYFSYE